MFHVFHVIKIYSVLFLFFSYDTLNEVYHFSGFQICLLIKTAPEGKSSFLAVSFKNISRKETCMLQNENTEKYIMSKLHISVTE